MDNSPTHTSFLDQALEVVRNMTEEEFLASIQAVEELKGNPKVFKDYSEEELMKRFKLSKEKFLQAQAGDSSTHE